MKELFVTDIYIYFFKWKYPKIPWRIKVHLIAKTPICGCE